MEQGRIEEKKGGTVSVYMKERVMGEKERKRVEGKGG